LVAVREMGEGLQGLEPCKRFKIVHSNDMT
jgi:hypothetical protein